MTTPQAVVRHRLGWRMATSFARWVRTERSRRRPLRLSAFPPESGTVKRSQAAPSPVSGSAQPPSGSAAASSRDACPVTRAAARPRVCGRSDCRACRRVRTPAAVIATGLIDWGRLALVRRRGRRLDRSPSLGAPRPQDPRFLTGVSAVEACCRQRRFSSCPRLQAGLRHRLRPAPGEPSVPLG